jgi:precorrin-4 methylase
MRAFILKSSFAFALIWVLLISLMPNSLFPMTVEKGKLYFVGVGPAGPEMATLQAIEVIKQTDVIFAPHYIQEPFKDYLQGKDVRLAWPDSIYMVDDKPYTYAATKEKMKRLGNAIMKHAASLSKQFQKEMSQGKSVALLVNGDPCLYSDLRWFKRHFDDSDFEVIPGMSSFNAGAALLKADLTQPRGLNTVIIYSPLGGVSEIRELAKHKATMVFFMAGRMKAIVKELKKEYDGQTPIALAYFIGYPDKQKVIKGNLNSILKDTESFLL